GNEFPQSTIVRGYWLPSIQAAIELDARNPGKAAEVLKLASAYGLGQQPLVLATLYPVYLRGQAYLLARQGSEAAAEFKKIIDHRGIVLNFSTGALAPLGVARADALQGDEAKGGAAYDDVLKIW